MHKLIRFISYIVAIILLVGCMSDQPQVIVITSTAVLSNIPEPTAVPIIATIDSQISATPTVIVQENPTTPPEQYIVQSGDTLSQIAQRYNVTLQGLINLNQISNPNLLEVGQVLLLPAPPTTFTPEIIIVSNSQLVRSPSGIGFDIDLFINNTSGYIKTATDIVDTRLSDGSIRKDTLSASGVIKRVATEYSIDERVLLAFLQYRARWLTESNLSDELVNYPLISESDSAGFDRFGLYKQLSWLANEINRGYYRTKYRNFSILTFRDGMQLLYNQSVNPATIALQYVLSLNNTIEQWRTDVSDNGFQQLYLDLFGNEVELASDPLRTISSQPLMTLPFKNGDVWRFTGGFHGGWGGGSAWAALDFAPPDDRQDGDPFCYISEYPVTAVANGVIARNIDGGLVLDLDGDGDERTGWTVLYLHLTVDTSITLGQSVSAGDVLGNASCFGGFSTATHLHIARRYNGEWIPADCIDCQSNIPFVMSNWQAVGLAGQEYQGFMINLADDQRVVAEQGRNVVINEISW